MRFFRIFLLHFQNVFEYRSRAFIWLIISLVGPLTMILFWNGASQTNSSSEFPFASIASYYFMLMLVGVMLTSHVEVEVSHEDIRDGGLTKYLTKPFSFYWINFFKEIPYRLLQGFYSLVILIIFALLFPSLVSFVTDPLSVVLTLSIFILGYLLSFTYKMLVGFIAFWLTDIGGFLQFENMIWIMLTGYVLPLPLLPSYIESIALFSPFSYMIYFPVLAAQGSLSHSQLFFTLFVQLCWLGVLLLFYQLLWRNGIKKYTAVGQ